MSPVPLPEPVHSWAPARMQVAATGLAAVLVAAAAATTDAPGRLLCAAGTLLLALLAARDGLVRPTLAVAPEGLVVARGVRRVPVAWSRVGAVTATESRRLLLNRSLEVEVDDELVVLAERRLGARAREVAAAVAELRPPAGRG